MLQIVKVRYLCVVFHSGDMSLIGVNAHIDFGSWSCFVSLGYQYGDNTGSMGISIKEKGGPLMYVYR